MKKFFFAALALLVATLASAQTRVYVYMTPDPSGIIDDAQRGKSNSVRDVVEKLKKSKSVTIVEDAGHADLSLEILSRGPEQMNTATTLPTPGVRGAQTFGNARMVIHAKLVSQNVAYTTELLGFAPSTYPNAWREAASVLAGNLEKFVKNNRDKLTER